MNSKTIHILQGPSGVGKSTLIARLKQEGKTVIEDPVRGSNLQHLTDEMGLYEIQSLIAGTFQHSLMEAINNKNTKDIYIDSGLEATQLINVSAKSLGLLSESESDILNKLRISFYNELIKLIKTPTTMVFHLLIKPIDVIEDQIKQRGTNELDNQIIVNYNDRFLNDEPNFITLVHQLKFINKNPNITLKLNKINNTEDWNTLPLKQLLKYD